MNKLIIFDLDGVLFESRDMHFEALNRALMYYGMKPITREDHSKKYNGLPSWKKLRMLGVKEGKENDILKMKQHYTRVWLTGNIEVNTSLVRLFDDLRRAGWSIAVASNAVRETVELGLTRLGLANRTSTYTPSEEMNPKPAPDMFFRAMAVADVTPENTVIVEDSKPGLEAARATGAKVIEVVGPHVVPTAVRDACL